MAGTRNPSAGLQKIGERVAQRVGEPLECLDSRVGPTGLDQRNNLLRQRGRLCEFNLGQACALTGCPEVRAEDHDRRYGLLAADRRPRRRLRRPGPPAGLSPCCPDRALLSITVMSICGTAKKAQ